MKGNAYFCAAFAVLLLAGHALAIRHHERPHRLSQGVSLSTVQSPTFDLCPTCVSFTGQALDILLNIILNSGVVGSCGTLCGELANKTGNKDLGVVCDLLCDYVGIKEFIKFIQNADLDPIYFCELLKVCKIVDNGDAKFTSLEVHPATGRRGRTFAIAFDWTTTNGTGTGEIVIEVITLDHLPVGTGNLIEPQQPGSYSGTASLSTDNSGCDPSQGPCEQWLPGQYTVKVAICNGECGSTHPHSQIYDMAEATFNITADASRL
ncbi:countin-1-like [Sycon ciliatum]|uniref:countin-1-like n=1 Tax=Sycon ciliatum TaxID=27933 RepID=UPI0020AB38EE|eukprot:scpid84869/ scgid12119/ Countin-1